MCGLDCAALDAEVASSLRAAWREHRLLIFRETVSNDDDLVALGECFGELRPSRVPSPLTTRPEVMVVSNIMVDGKLAGGFPDGEIEWHYDGMHQEEPYSGAILYAQEVPSRGGETRFADMCRAYETLPEATKTRVRGLKALSTFDYTTRDGEGKQLSDDTPRAVHPIARELPDGRTSIFVAKLMTDHIVDIEPRKHAIWAIFYEQMSRPEFSRTLLRPGAVLWDNAGRPRAERFLDRRLARDDPLTCRIFHAARRGRPPEPFLRPHRRSSRRTPTSSSRPRRCGRAEDESCRAQPPSTRPIAPMGQQNDGGSTARHAWAYRIIDVAARIPAHLCRPEGRYNLRYLSRREAREAA